MKMRLPLSLEVLAALASYAVALPSSSAAASSEYQRHHKRAPELLGSNFGIPTYNRTFDYIVVGGGNAGLPLAYRLAQDGKTQVAVIEAGSFYEISTGNTSQIPANDVYWTGTSLSDVNPLVDWGFHTTPQAGLGGAVAHYARGKTLGGCTARNYMAYQRPTTESMQVWADKVGDQSYTFENMLKWYKKSLNFQPPRRGQRFSNATPEYDQSTLNIGGPLNVSFPNYAQAFSTWIRNAFQELGIRPIKAFTSGNLIGSSWDVTTINSENGERASSEAAFLRPVLESGRTNLVVYPETLAKKVLFDGTKAIGVLVDTSGAEYVLSAKKEVIVSAGVFQSPQLLMVSGVGPAATLKQYDIPVVKDSPGVGQNMIDQLLFGPSYRVKVSTASSLAPGLSSYYEAVDKFYSKHGGPLSSPGGDFLGFEKIPQSLRSSFSNNTLKSLAEFPADWPEVEYLAVAAYFGNAKNLVEGSPADGSQYATLAIGLVAPTSRGNISISSSDMSDAPLINPNFLGTETDREVAIAAFRRVRQVFNSNAMAPVVDGQEVYPGSQYQTDNQILDYISSSFSLLFHASSTCKMGSANDSMAVIDPTAKVYGVQNLRVVDTSSFPILPPGHPMSTVYALAEKIAADIISGN
ncbi:glucose-methanol-choline oxidoreductase [Talaromyces proteolyticus]|uniref:Glucose-methanol-choline oxidoreductase n=1 Tax=Talaromyces proteolyticus TaxID=1131652 RepID=A0AAD4KXC8_9EURO|nr:glucose-methanol-choline oxidoreductase [Talaromyces proteolyticus]KAH8703285.1 glucose-methanol-choline oxidoreductase [Talaromyces proteolyticus]